VHGESSSISRQNKILQQTYDYLLIFPRRILLNHERYVIFGRGKALVILILKS
jgi:hypothetical protein